MLYGVGARLDRQPELFFTLRGVDWNELVAADIAPGTLSGAVAREESLQGADLSGLFGIELADEPPPAPEPQSGAEAKKPVTASELRAQGVTRSAIQYWLRTGVLERSDRPGRYIETAHTRERVQAWLARRAP